MHNLINNDISVSGVALLMNSVPTWHG